MLSHIRDNLLGTREGQILVFASVLYLGVGALAKFVPSVVPLSPFYAWLCLLMPVPLALFYVKLGGFSKRFKSGAFNSTIMALVAAWPALVKVYALYAF